MQKEGFMTKDNTNHIRIRNEPGTIGVMFCEHCGGEERLTGKMPIDSVNAWINAFTRQHKNCVKTEKKND